MARTLSTLRGVLIILQKHRLYAKLSKCYFGIKEVEYLRHVVSGQGVAMENSKIQAVTDWKTPTDVKCHDPTQAVIGA